MKTELRLVYHIASYCISINVCYLFRSLAGYCFRHSLSVCQQDNSKKLPMDFYEIWEIERLDQRRVD